MRSLLGEPEAPAIPGVPATLSMQKSVEDVFSKIKRAQGGGRSVLREEGRREEVQGNDFLRDLSRM